MGATTFYGWPYPDPGSDVDIPRDIQALADKLETMKDGLTVPNGPIVGGAPFSTTIGGTSRPVPFAMQTNKVAVADHGSGGATNQVHTLLAGRFTQVPVIVCSAYCAGSRLNATVNSTPAPTVSGMTISTINLQTNTATLCFVAWWAIQMTSGVSPGLLEGQSTVTHNLTCHTAGCENAEIPIPMDMSAADIAYCGVCGQPIEDIVAAKKVRRT